MSPTAKILVIRGGAIGDFILTLPVFAALRRQFPEIHLEVLGYPHVARLALLDGTVNAVKPIEARALAGFFAREGTLDPGWSDYFSEFAVIISYLYDPDEIFRANVTRRARGQFIAGPHRPGGAASIHAAQVFLKPLEPLAILAPDPISRIVLPPGPAPVPPRVALHPGSGSEKKNWPEPRWAELCRLFVEHTGVDLLLVGGEAEGARISRLAAALPPERTRLAQSLPLPDLARELAGCSSFIGHDSGISHLAGALDLEALLLWGDSPEAVWRPLNPRASVHRPAEGLRLLTAAKVFDLWRQWTR